MYPKSVRLLVVKVLYIAGNSQTSEVDEANSPTNLIDASEEEDDFADID